MKTTLNESVDCMPVIKQPKNSWREIIIRFVSITLISGLSVFLDFGYDQGMAGFLKPYLVSFIRTALIWNGSMFIIQYAIDRYSIFRETTKLIVFQVITLSVFVLLVESGEIFAVENYLKIPMSHSAKFTLIIGSLLITFMISSIYASVAFFIQWKENLLRTQALEKANFEARYDTLRNQVNPHFLFNSLNTLLMLVDNNPVASRYVESISEIMRYMLQSRDKEAVMISDELKIARDYIFIQQSRFGEKLQVSFDVPDECLNQLIPPLTMQMLLENAIKHKVVSKEQPLIVKVFTEANAFLVIQNNIQARLDREPSTGVGLENIRSRYHHLCGKEIAVSSEQNMFTVKLPFFGIE